jgi:hypothetical protein
MYPYMNEDAAWERVKDLQREMDNSRLWASSTVRFLSLLSEPLVWLFEGLVLTLRPLPAPARAAREWDDDEEKHYSTPGAA